VNEPGIDPGAAWVATLAFVVGVALLPDGGWSGWLAAYGVLLLAALALRLSLVRLLARSLLALPFVVAVAAIPFTTPGEVAGQLPWGWTFSHAGLVKAGSVLARAWLSIQAFVILMVAYPLTDLLTGLERLGLPGLLVNTIGFAYRYLNLIRQEAERMLRARQARAAGKGPAGGKTWFELASTGGLLGSLFLRSLDRSERVYDAMLARGYQGNGPTWRQLRWTGRDLLLVLTALGGLILCWWQGRGWV
jgi:cobalt/nickel transport system permease protein